MQHLHIAIIVSYNITCNIHLQGVTPPHTCTWCTLCMFPKHDTVDAKSSIPINILYDHRMAAVLELAITTVDTETEPSEI